MESTLWNEFITWQTIKDDDCFEMSQFWPIQVTHKHLLCTAKKKYYALHWWIKLIVWCVSVFGMIETDSLQLNLEHWISAWGDSNWPLWWDGFQLKVKTISKRSYVPRCLFVYILNAESNRSSTMGQLKRFNGSARGRSHFQWMKFWVAKWEQCTKITHYAYETCTSTQMIRATGYSIVFNWPLLYQIEITPKTMLQSSTPKQHGTMKRNAQPRHTMNSSNHDKPTNNWNECDQLPEITPALWRFRNTNCHCCILSIHANAMEKC